MKNSIKSALILGIGSVGGFLIGTVMTGKLFLDSEGVRREVVKEILNDMYGQSTPKTSYRKYYPSYSTRSNFDWSEDRWPKFTNEEDTNNVFKKLKTLASQYGQVSVVDLYDLSALPTDYTMTAWGWTDSRIQAAKGVTKLDDKTWTIILQDPIKLK